MIFAVILTALAFVCFCIASYNDFKTKEVPDYLTGFFIISALLIRALWALNTWDYWKILWACAFAPIALGVSYLFYKLKFWGGGDVKLMVGAAIALSGFENGLFFDKFVLNFLLVAPAYGIIATIILAFKNWKGVSKGVKKQKKTVIAIFCSWFLFLVLFYAFTEFKSLIMFFILGNLLFFLSFLYVLCKNVELFCFYKKVNPEKLVEGDWLEEDVKIDGKIICKKGKILSEDDVNKLLKYKSNGKINKVLIKEGIPFIPSFLVNYIVTLLLPNLFSGFSKALFA